MRTDTRMLIAVAVLATLTTATALHAQPETGGVSDRPAGVESTERARGDSGVWLCGGGRRVVSGAGHLEVETGKAFEAFEPFEVFEVLELAGRVGGLTSQALALATAFEEGSGLRELARRAAPVARATARVIVDLVELKIALKF